MFGLPLSLFNAYLGSKPKKELGILMGYLLFAILLSVINNKDFFFRGTLIYQFWLLLRSASLYRESMKSISNLVLSTWVLAVISVAVIGNLAQPMYARFRLNLQVKDQFLIRNALKEYDNIQYLNKALNDYSHSNDAKAPFIPDLRYTGKPSRMLKMHISAKARE